MSKQISPKQLEALRQIHNGKWDRVHRRELRWLFDNLYITREKRSDLLMGGYEITSFGRAVLSGDSATAEKASQPHVKNPIFTDEDLRGFYDTCVWMESNGNSGWYSRHLTYEAGGKFIIGKKFVTYRKGIVFYSTGWGWRLRKNWRETFGQRFYETVVNWTNVSFVTKPPRTLGTADLKTQHEYIQWVEQPADDIPADDYIDPFALIKEDVVSFTFLGKTRFGYVLDFNPQASDGRTVKVEIWKEISPNRYSYWSESYNPKDLTLQPHMTRPVDVPNNFDLMIGGRGNDEYAEPLRPVRALHYGGADLNQNVVIEY